MARPASIVLFEKCYLAAVALGVAGQAASWESLMMAARARLPEAGAIAGPALFASAAVWLAISLLLWWFIARRASNVAKWLFVVLTAYGLFSFLTALANPAVPKSWVSLLAALTTGLQLYAAWLLFRPDAAAWLEAKGADPAADAAGIDGNPIE